MLTGKRVEGTIGYDKWTGKKTFRMFNRLSRLKPRDEMVKKLPGGWVKRSQRRWKTYVSVDSDRPIDEVLAHMRHDHREAEMAIATLDIIENA